MRVANKPDVTVTPGSDNSIILLSYGTDRTNYLLLGTNRKNKDQRKFVYLSTTEIQGKVTKFLTSPFHTTDMNDGSSIPCAQRRDITSALVDPNPVIAVVEVLRNSFQELRGNGKT